MKKTGGWYKQKNQENQGDRFITFTSPITYKSAEWVKIH